MKKVTINFITIHNNIYIKIFNSKKNLIYEDYICRSFDICLNMYDTYLFVIYVGDRIIRIPIIIVCDKYYISLDRIITFSLTDSFYKGLKIEKGEIILWQKMLL